MKPLTSLKGNKNELNKNNITILINYFIYLKKQDTNIKGLNTDFRLFQALEDMIYFEWKAEVNKLFAIDLLLIRSLLTF